MLREATHLKAPPAMPRKIKILVFLFSLALLGSVSPGQAEDEGAVAHPGPWPIHHWREYQPRRSDLTPKQSKRIDQLYDKIEKEDPNLIAPDYRDR
jgi:hypothetical protein